MTVRLGDSSRPATTDWSGSSAAGDSSCSAGTGFLRVFFFAGSVWVASSRDARLICWDCSRICFCWIWDGRLAMASSRSFFCCMTGDGVASARRCRPFTSRSRSGDCMRFIVNASTSGAPLDGCCSAANASGDRHSGDGGPLLPEGAVLGRGVSLELRRWLRVGFTGVAVESRASAFEGDKASWIAAICSALPTPGRGWSQTWSARRRDAPVLVERCESPEALRADRVEAADWGRCIGIVSGVATASGAGCPSARGARLPSAVCRPASEGALVTLHAGALRTTRRFREPRTFFCPPRLRGL